MNSEQCAKSDWTRITDQVATLKADLERSQTSNHSLKKELEAQWDSEAREQKAAIELSRELEKSTSMSRSMYARASKLEHENEELQEELIAAKQLVSEYQDLYRSAQKERDEWVKVMERQGIADKEEEKLNYKLRCTLETVKKERDELLASVTKASAPLTELLEISAMLLR